MDEAEGWKRSGVNECRGVEESRGLKKGCVWRRGKGTKQMTMSIKRARSRAVERAILT